MVTQTPPGISYSSIRLRVSAIVSGVSPGAPSISEALNGILERLAGNPIPPNEMLGVKRFAQVSLRGWQGREREATKELVEIYDLFFHALTRLEAQAKERTL